MDKYSANPRKVLWFLVIVLAVGVLTGMSYEALATQRSRSRGTPGRLVEVGGYPPLHRLPGTRIADGGDRQRLGERFRRLERVASRICGADKNLRLRSSGTRQER